MKSNFKNQTRQWIKIVGGLIFSLILAGAPGKIWASENETVEKDTFLNLGTEEGIGGKDFSRFERGLIKDQIKSFIPPLLRGATPIHAYVLPPNTYNVEFSTRFAHVTDFFANGDKDPTFRQFAVNRNFIDLSIFYGFDLNQKYLHSFTAFLNIPFINTATTGVLNPNGVNQVSIDAGGATSQKLGDISLIIKKKIVDQANFPFGLAIAAGVYFPTGSNDEKYGYGNDGKVSIQAPRFPLLGLSQPPVGIPLPINFLMNQGIGTGQFPFNNGIFNRFSDDGRLPNVLQPGDGGYGYALGGFLTRQFLPGNVPFLDRGAFHLGTVHRFRPKIDGIKPGDTNTHLASFVIPLYKDYFAVETGYLGFYQNEDQYDGKFIVPFATDANGNILPAGQANYITFKQVDRPPFSRGEWGNTLFSLIYTPDPVIRLVGSGLFRVVSPDLGPAPNFVLRFGLDVVF